MEIKSINPKLKRSEIAKELALPTSTLQRYRKKINILPTYGKPSSSNTHTRKQKTLNHTERDHKMTSSDLKMTSNDLTMTSNERVKNQRDKKKCGDPCDNQNDGRDLIEQAFSFN